MPDNHGNRAARLASHDDFEKLGRRCEIGQQRVLGISGKHLRKREMPKDSKDIFFRREEWSLQSRGAELQQRIALEKMPRDAGAQINGALETLGGYLL